jgi:hypothetical protein
VKQDQGEDGRTGQRQDTFQSWVHEFAPSMAAVSAIDLGAARKAIRIQNAPKLTPMPMWARMMP